MEDDRALEVTLAAPAPGGGVHMNLASSDPSVATVSPSLALTRANETMRTMQLQVSGNNVVRTPAVGRRGMQRDFATEIRTIPVMTVGRKHYDHASSAEFAG